MIKTNTGVHEAQELHSEAECKINEVPHNHPETDCGHYVASGPGMEKQEERPNVGPDGMAPPHNSDQDPEHGPGVQK